MGKNYVYFIIMSTGFSGTRRSVWTCLPILFCLFMLRIADTLAQESPGLGLSFLPGLSALPLGSRHCRAGRAGPALSLSVRKVCDVPRLAWPPAPAGHVTACYRLGPSGGRLELPVWKSTSVPDQFHITLEGQRPLFSKPPGPGGDSEEFLAEESTAQSSLEPRSFPEQDSSLRDCPSSSPAPRVFSREQPPSPPAGPSSAGGGVASKAKAKGTEEAKAGGLGARGGPR